MGPGSLLQILFQWCKRAAGLCLRKPGFGPTEAQAFVLQRCTLCCAVLCCVPWPAASSVCHPDSFSTLALSSFLLYWCPTCTSFCPRQPGSSQALGLSCSCSKRDLGWRSVSISRQLEATRQKEVDRTTESAVQDRKGEYVFSDSVLTQFWVRDLTLSKSHTLMQGLETLSPTPDLSSLLTSFKWISLCLRVKLRNHGDNPAKKFYTAHTLSRC